MVNHAYTLALYRTGERVRLADVAFDIASGFLDIDPASAMDYFQRAIQAGLDSVRLRRIGEIYEEWAGDRAAGKIRGNVVRVGHVVRSLPSAQPLTVYIRMLARSLKARGISSVVFTTEADIAWFMNPDSTSRTAATAVEPDARVVIGGTGGDFMERAARVAESIREAELQVVFYHSGFSDQIAARIAAIHPSAVQISVTHEDEIAADLFDGVIYPSQSWRERIFTSGIAELIPPSSDFDAHLRTDVFETRDSLGIQAAATVSASFGGPQRDQREFVKTLIELMRRYPNHFQLFAGNADVRAFRSVLHEAEVLPRIRFLGQVSDVTRLFGVTDLYLAPFPDSGRTAILDLMAAGKPMVALRHAAESASNTAAELIHDPELTPRTPMGYIDIADRLIRDVAARVQFGDRLRERFLRDFAPDLLGERYVAFFERLR